MKRSILGLLLLLATTPVLAGDSATLDQAVTMAIEHNANVGNARLEIAKSETRVAATKTQRLPSLTLEAIGGEALNNLSIEIDDGPNGKTRVDLARTFSMLGLVRIVQPLTQLHAINLGVQLNETAVKVDRERERAARLAITREVKSAYFAVLSAQAYAEAMKEAVTAWEEVEREMNVRVAQKVVLEADRLDASARLASTRVAALSATNTLATANDRLDYLVGKDIDVVEAELTPPGAAAPHGVERRPDVREAELRVEQARLAVKLQAADRIPDVALMVSSATPFNNDVLPRNMTSAGITMKYEPFTWGRRKAEMTEKRHALEQAENALRDKRSAAAVEIAALQRKAEEAAAQIAVRRLEAEAAKERLRVTRTKFQQLAARPDEVMNAGASLTAAAAREQEAISAYWTARADYEQAIGED